MSAPLRLTVRGRDARCLHTTDTEDRTVSVAFGDNAHTQSAAGLLGEGMTVNAVDWQMDADGVVHPAFLIVEPDYLIDVSTLTACLKPCGVSAWHYFLHKFQSSEPTRYTLLGHVANQFLDECVNERQPSFERALQRCFQEHLLDFCATPGIDARFFRECRTQFDHIARFAETHQLYGRSLLEPSYFCQILGLQGRMDLLTTDGTLLVELKSGKMDTFRGTAQASHALQVLLYKEILRHTISLPTDHLRATVFYSRHGQAFEQTDSVARIQEVLTLRNQIVHIERLIAEGEADRLIRLLTPERLCTNPDVSPHFWEHWGRPEIEQTLRPLQQMDGALRDYVLQFLRFIQREQAASKVPAVAQTPDRCMSSLWLTPPDAKVANGDMITGLTASHPRSQTSIPFRLPARAAHNINFRQSDPVILYSYVLPTDNATHRQVLRATVESITQDTITLRMRQEPHASIDDLPFALEHDYLESALSSQYSGLMALIKAPAERRQLLLGQRMPRAGEDYTLVVGPPGTGKTSVKLRNLVIDALRHGQTILLSAYTNRAVDEICQMLHTIEPVPPYLRLGRPHTCDPRYHSHLFGNAPVTDRQSVHQLLDACPIIVATVATLCARQVLFALKTFDIAIFDEASQILEPQILPILCATRQGEPAVRRFTLIGDHKQLPAVVAQRPIDSLRSCAESIFHRLHSIVGDMPEFTTVLDRQGRMNSDIARFSNDHFYHGRIQALGLPHQTDPIYPDAPAENPLCCGRMLYVPVRPLQPVETKVNPAEADTIALLVHYIRALAVQTGQERSVGIIIPFRRQVACVQQRLQALGVPTDDLLIDTVERFQGSQRDIILYGVTITSPDEWPLLCEVQTIDGVPVDRKLNVAVTRARRQFILVGCETVLRAQPLYADLVDVCTRISRSHFT